MHSTAPKKSRNLTARPLVNATPVTFTDLTCFDVTGLVADQMRKTVRKYGVRHVVEGHRMIVRVDDWLAFVERNAAVPDAAPVVKVVDDSPQDESAVLARLGFRRTA